MVAVDNDGKLLAENQMPIPAPMKNDGQVTQDPTQWWKAVNNCLKMILPQIDVARVCAIAVDGTSGTLLICDKKGHPVTPALMYNDSRAVSHSKKILAVAGKNTGAHGASSSLAKLLWLQDKKFDKKGGYVLHQADWIAGKLSGMWGHSDYNNALKLGYDAESRQWPGWLEKLGINESLLPEVHAPGDILGTVSADVANKFGLPENVDVIAGTTDGVASFLAAQASEPGHGVTSLGTTLTLKLLSRKPVFSPQHGVYSHRLGKYWLAGGASNSGGSVLLQYFKVEQMEEMTALLDPDSATGLDYYPLPSVGERFPINDPEMVSRLEPLPGNSVHFFQGMLEGIARIEAEGYQLLHKLGAPALVEVRTTGGGSRNDAWTRIRERTLSIKVKPARSGLAAYGTAMLAAGVVVKTFN